MAGTTTPAKPRRVALPVTRWPTADQQAWENAQRAGDFLSDDGAATQWRPATHKAAIGAYGRWLAFLDDHGLLDGQAGPTGHLNPASLRAYVGFLHDKVSSQTIASYIGVLSMMVQALTPGTDWRWLLEVQSRLQRRASPSRNKRIRIVPIRELMQLGADLMVRAENSTADHPFQAAQDYRDGFMIVLLASCPLRQRNFVGIEIGRHVVPCGKGYILVFPASETKAARPLEFAFPLHLLPMLKRYLAQYRPYLLALRTTRGHTRQASLANPGSRLWITQYGTAFSGCAQYKALCKRTAERFGHKVNPHLFRDCAATSVAIDTPDHVGICAQILGHTGLQSAERYYIAAGAKIANNAYQQAIMAIRGKK